MTRLEAEHAILLKVHEIQAILAAYSDRDNLMICIGENGFSFWNCGMRDTRDVLDCSEHDGRAHSWDHKEEMPNG